MMMVQKENKVHIYNAKYMYSSAVDVGTAVDFPQRQKQIRVNIMLQGVTA